MRIDLTVRASDGTARDVAVVAPAGTPHTRLVALLTGYSSAASRLHHGAVLTADAGRSGTGQPGRPGASFTATHRIDVVCGPDSGRSIPLARAPLSIGRATGCDLVLHDPGVSRVHADIALTPHGATVRDRGSANGTAVDGTAADATGLPIRTGRYVRLGDTYLAVSAARSPAALTRWEADGTAVVNRPPRAVHRLAAEPLEAPPAPAEGHKQRISWLAALVPAGAGVALAVSLHAPQFLLFALLSPIALLATALSDRLHWRRDRRRGRARYRSELAAFERRVAVALGQETRARRMRDPDPTAVLHTASLPGVRLWERSREDPSLLRVRIGLGELSSQTLIRADGQTRPAGSLPAVPVSLDLASGPLAICGPRDVVLAIARWIIGQLATHCSPADIEVAFILSASAGPAWHWARWLPHLRARVADDQEERQALVDELQEVRRQRSTRARPEARWGGAWLLVVLDECADLGELSGLAELLIEGPRVGITALCIDARHGALPAGCATLARAGGETGSRVTLTGGGGHNAVANQVSAVTDQVSADWAEQLARSLAPLRDPGSEQVDAIPDSCQLLPLLGLGEPSAESILSSWRTERAGLSTPLGISVGGPLKVDLIRDGPHALVAGTTGSGKSELLRSLVAGLAVRYPPETVVFVLVDYKGGAAFAECAALPHTVGVVTDLDAHLAQRALQSLERELIRREELLALCGADTVDSYRAVRPDQPIPRLVIVIDEFAELAAELGEFVSGLVAIARRGRSLGVHLVLATQRPSGVVSPEIRANTALRIALRVTDPAESRDVLDADAAATIGRYRPGRAYLRLPGAPLVALQTAHVGASTAAPSAVPRLLELGEWRRLPLPRADELSALTDLQLLVAAAEEAATRSRRRPPERPWLAPLPERVSVTDLRERALPVPQARPDATGRIPLGLCDLPRAQQQVPFIVDLRSGGSLLFAGGPRSGRTSALLTLAITAAAELPPDRLHIYAVDCAGGELGLLARLPQCGSVVGAEPVSTATLIARLEQEVTARRAILAQHPDSVLPMLLWVLDGWDAFVAAADDYDAGRTVDVVCALLRAAPSVQMTVVITGDRAALAVRLSSAVATKLVLRLTDRADYALVGLSDRAVPTSLPPGRAVRAEDGVEIQLAHLGGDRSRCEQDAALHHAATAWRGYRTGARTLIRVCPLPDHLSLNDLRQHPLTGTEVVLGVGGDQSRPVTVDLFAGAGRLLVAGPPRSGRSTVLSVLLTQLLDAECVVLLAAPPRSPLTLLAHRHGLPLIAPDQAFDPPADNVRTVLLVDDCESFLDTPAGVALTDWIRVAPSRLAVVAAGSSDELAVSFRGLSAEVRRSRCSVLLHPGPGDSELAGSPLARRRAGSPPGRGLLIGDPAWGQHCAAGPIPIQIAQP